MELSAKFRYIPSPIPFKYRMVYSATVNKSGRMQYHRIRPGVSKERISRNEFIDVFNTSTILGMRPIPYQDAQVIQLEFYV